MKTSLIDITVIVTVHDEESMAWRSIRSARAAMAKAEQAGYGTELLVVASGLYTKTQKTMNLLLDLDLKLRVLPFAPPDLGLARNFGVEFAKGRYVAMLDGDDIFGEDWLVKGVEYLDKLGDPLAVAHPQVNIYFGAEALWFQHKDQREEDFDFDLFHDNNCWTSLSMARHSFFAAFPYVRQDPGFGYEDWEWHKRTIALDALHVAVPETVHFVRRKRDSLLKRTTAEHRLVPASCYEVATTFRGKVAGFKAAPVGDWLEVQWKKANEFECELWPEANRLASMPRFKPVSAGLGPTIRALCAALHGAEIVILTPWLARGGAEKFVLAHAEAAKRAGSKCVIVLTDAGLASDWKSEAACPVIALSDLTADPGKSLISLVRALVWAKPRVLHIINSRGGFVAVTEHGAAFKSCGTKIIASLFCEDKIGMSERPMGFAFDGTAARALHQLDYVLTDNAKMNGHVREQLGFDPARVITVGIPIAPGLQPRDAPADAKPLRVFWANRFVWQKAPDLLLKIATAALAAKKKFVFVVKGSAPSDQNPVLRDIAMQLSALPNVELDMTPWKLDYAEVDIYLHTARWDGCPIVALDALASGVPVVTTPVGAFTDPEICSVIVPHDAPIEQWLEALSLVASNRKALGAKGRANVIANYNLSSFDAKLAAVGYF